MDQVRESAIALQNFQLWFILLRLNVVRPIIDKVLSFFIFQAFENIAFKHIKAFQNNLEGSARWVAGILYVLLSLSKLVNSYPNFIYVS